MAQSKIVYINGLPRHGRVLIGHYGRDVLFPIYTVHLNVKTILGRDYDWAISHIKQTERLSGAILPSVWFPDTFGLQCDVLYWDDKHIILQSGASAYELVNVTEYDIWRNHDGKIKALPARVKFVTAIDAPYGYAYHEQRVTAKSAREAISIYRKDK